MASNEDNVNDLGGSDVPESALETADLPADRSALLGPQLVLEPEDYPNVDHLITRDDTPVESIYAEKQMRLLTEPLYSSWAGPGDGGPFVALANVGLFFTVQRPPLVPDVLLSLDVSFPKDLQDKRHRSYFLWEYGKMPDVIVEIVSDRKGGEDTLKLRDYARHGLLYYVIYDPSNLLKGGVLRILELHVRQYEPRPDQQLPEVGLGLTFWRGGYEGAIAQWLRWCDSTGTVVPTGRERAERALEQAEQERQRAERALEQVEQERQRAEQERQRAEQAIQQSEEQRERQKRLEAQLRAMGIEPSP